MRDRWLQTGELLPTSSNQHQTLDPALLERTFSQLYRAGDLNLRRLMAFHFLFGLAIAPVYDTWFIALAGGLACVLLFLVPAFLLPGSFLTRSLAGVSLMLFCAQHIFQMHGMTEMHFFYFTALTAMLIYRDWKALLAGTFAVTVHHLLLAALEMQGVKVRFFDFNSTGMDYLRFGLHLLVVVVHFVICAWWAQSLRVQTLDEILTKQELEKRGREMSILNSRLEERAEQQDKLLSESQQNEAQMKKSMQELEAARAAMQTNESRLMEQKALLEQTTWQEENLRRLDDIMRNRLNSSLEIFCDTIVNELCQFTHALQGVVYVQRQDTGNLHALGAFAANSRALGMQFGAGEGIVGQAFKNQLPFFMDRMEMAAAGVRTSLTVIPPSCLLVQPLVYNQESYGALELLFAKPLEPQMRRFLEKASANIAAVIQNIQNNEKVRKLLQESQHFAEMEMQKTEELRQNMEEMMATQEELARTRRELETQLQQLAKHA